MWSNRTEDFTDDTMNISGQTISVKRGSLANGDLRYWPMNPRIYSIVHASEDPLDQDEIQIELQSRDHVKQLFRDIKHHGGLIDPIVVIDRSFDVIEGNSRLAAIRWLAQKDPAKFGLVKCVILPHDISETLIYSFLNQEHIQGKHKWSPYEEAGVIYRLITGGMSLDSLLDELGISKRKANSMYQIYKFMVSHKEDNPSRYSYYEVYLTNRKAKQRRKAEPTLDQLIVKEIQSENLTAQEFRTMLPHVCDNDKQFKSFIAGKCTVSSAYEVLERQGKTEDLVRRLKRIRMQLQEMTKEEFDELTAKPQKDAEYQLKRVITLAQNLKKSVYG